MQIPSIHELSSPTFRESCIDPSLICDSSSCISGDQGRLYPVLALKKQKHILNFLYSVDKPAGIVSHRCSLDRWTPGRAECLKCFQTHQIESWWPTGSQEGPKDVEVDV